MRIQHNIPAMSSYRNYTNNTSAVSKNLERLSSGYRINRAGDDAAGLAISEKMRAQITGLNAASKNAKDGISLVKTAEGALQEVHDMLNRMVNLATQSANGTYDDTTDRNQLQKEVNQLRSEINRIADSANFNGIKLFDGTMEANKEEYLLQSASAMDIYDTVGTDTTKVGTSTIIHSDGRDAKKTSFSVELDNVFFTSTGACTAGKVNVGGTQLTVTLAANQELSGNKLAENILSGLTNNEVKIANNTYSVSVDGSKLVFTMSDETFDKYKNAAPDNINTKTVFNGNFDVSVTGGTGGGAASVKGNVNQGTQIITEGNAYKPGTLANTELKTALTKDNIKDGTAFRIGDTTYVFTTKDETKDAVRDAGSKFVSVDISDIVDEDGVLSDDKVGHADSAVTGDGSGAVSEALSRLTIAAKDNKMFTVGQARSSGAGNGATKVGTLTFQERADYKGDGKGGRADLTTLKGIQDQLQMGTFGKVITDAAKGSGKGLTLQIGDTADSYNQLKVSLQDMHCDSLGIDSVNIADQSDAQAAIETIKNAINTVSDVRGTLGATQNRLDHTINNLSVMTENIQDAESTIRDVDIAEEMMAYTKNNILVQSAQAMLAQANQIPQGVLQLLG